MDRKALENMLEQGQDNAMLRYTLGTLLLKEGLPDDAIAHLERAVSMDTNHSASWKLYAKALTEQGNTDAAIVAYEKGIDIAETRGDIQAAKEMKVFLKRLGKRAGTQRNSVSTPV